MKTQLLQFTLVLMGLLFHAILMSQNSSDTVEINKPPKTVNNGEATLNSYEALQQKFLDFEKGFKILTGVSISTTYPMGLKSRMPEKSCLDLAMITFWN